MTNFSCKFLFMLAASSALLIAHPASAVTTTLTGGDTADGLVLTGTLAGAIFTNSGGTGATTTPITLQNYTLSPYTTNGATVSNITATGATVLTRDGFVAAETPTSAGFTNPTTPSANDTALINVVNSGLLYAAGTASVTFTIKGLTAGTSYNLNFLTCATGYGARSEVVSINGAAGDLINITNVNAIYDTTDIGVASGTGTITAVLSEGGTGTQDGDFTNAVIVTTVPEPSTWATVAVATGLLAMAIRLRKPTRA